MLKLSRNKINFLLFTYPGDGITPWEVRGQLSGVHSLLPLCRIQDQTQVIRLGLLSDLVSQNNAMEVKEEMREDKQTLPPAGCGHSGRSRRDFLYPRVSVVLQPRGSCLV